MPWFAHRPFCSDGCRWHAARATAAMWLIADYDGADHISSAPLAAWVASLWQPGAAIQT